MKFLLFTILSFWAISGLQAQNYSIQNTNNAVKFKIKNLGIWISGVFGEYSGAIVFSPENLSASKFSVQIKTSSINTGIELRDDHLKKEEYFDEKNYPTISFVSTKVTLSNKKGTLYMFGKLNVKGKEMDLSFPFSALPQENGYRFQGQFKINRRDLGVGGSSVTMSDEVTVLLDVYTQKS